MSQYFTSIAPLYAKILFDYALEVGKLDDIIEQVARIKEILTQNNGLIEDIAAPIYSIKQKEQLLSKIAECLKLSLEVANLLDLLAKNKKLSSLNQIIDYFELLLDKHQGNKIVEVIVAHDLSLEQQDKIKEQLANLLDSKVKVSFKLDSKILGGLIIKYDNKMIDASIANRFTYLTETIKNNISQLELNKEWI